MNASSDSLSFLPVDLSFTSESARLLYNGLPAPATGASAGTDLRAVIDGDTEIPPGGRFPFPTGIRIQPLCPGWAGFLYSRSGLGARDGLTVAQGVGVIDPDYTGEICVVLLNTSGNVRRIRRGDRIAQLIFQPYAVPRYTIVNSLGETGRGDGGFGHTGR